MKRRSGFQVMRRLVGLVRPLVGFMALAILMGFITVLGGYAVAGALGGTLSGGEHQRLGLARAFLHQGDFLLLDEPTSNLDSLIEAVILKSLGEERGNQTVLLVSHRKSTMRVADKVYSVENGRMS